VAGSQVIKRYAASIAGTGIGAVPQDRLTRRMSHPSLRSVYYPPPKVSETPIMSKPRQITRKWLVVALTLNAAGVILGASLNAWFAALCIVPAALAVAFDFYSPARFGA